MKRRYIIFADDDADDLELITGYFKQYDSSITVLELRDGKEVLKFLHDFASATSMPLLIVLDINMPRLNGKETLLRIRQLPVFQYIPIVIYTTSSNRKDEEYCRRLGASWLTKPSSVDGVRKAAKIMAEFCHLS
jgi:CheY-like chemotaxis protein